MGSGLKTRLWSQQGLCASKGWSGCSPELQWPWLEAVDLHSSVSFAACCAV